MITNQTNGSFATRIDDVLVRCCVACGSFDWSFIEAWHGYKLASCSECGLTFTVNPDYKPDRYIAAYEDTSGQIPVPEPYSYLYAAPEQRLKLEAQALWIPPSRLTPSEKLALKWLIAKAAKSAIVIDCGCGAGRFLRSCQRTGFQAVGVEVSGALVELLSRSGLRAIRGMAPDFPWDDSDPFAITLFEVLEHIPNPGNVVQDLKARFPKASILASVPSPFRVQLLLHGQRGASDFPPNHFLRWTPKALEIFFHKLGYSNVTVEVPPPVGSELMPGLGQIFSKRIRFRRPASLKYAANSSFTADTETRSLLLRKLESTGAVWMHRGYQQAINLIGTPIARSEARKGGSAASMLVIAEP